MVVTSTQSGGSRSSPIRPGSGVLKPRRPLSVPIDQSRHATVATLTSYRTTDTASSSRRECRPAAKDARAADKSERKNKATQFAGCLLASDAKEINVIGQAWQLVVDELQRPVWLCQWKRRSHPCLLFCEPLAVPRKRIRQLVLSLCLSNDDARFGLSLLPQSRPNWPPVPKIGTSLCRIRQADRLTRRRRTAPTAMPTTPKLPQTASEIGSGTDATASWTVTSSIPTLVT